MDHLNRKCHLGDGDTFKLLPVFHASLEAFQAISAFHATAPRMLSPYLPFSQASGLLWTLHLKKRFCDHLLCTNLHKRPGHSSVL